MGWSWSLHFCQSFVSNVVANVLGQDRMILDKRAGVVLDSRNTHAGAAYVDNYCVLNTSQDQANDPLGDPILLLTISALKLMNLPWRPFVVILLDCILIMGSSLLRLVDSGSFATVLMNLSTDDYDRQVH